eukprot:scaffold4520_cov96-Isochrysis_galbana.AAC.3
MLWEYELYGGAQLAPHRLYVLARLIHHAPERGVGRPPRNSPPPSEHEVKVPFPASLCLPCLVATCLGSVLVFVLRELDPPLPPRKGG